jgi:hypothetical protein
MRFIDPNCQPKSQGAQSCPHWITVATLCFIAAASVASFAQSGRKQSPPRAESAAPATAAKESKKEVPLAFVVATAVSNSSEQMSAYAGYAQALKLDHQARGGCLLELKDKLGAKVIEDEEVARWEARETAQTDGNAWVIWLELKWEPASSPEPVPFKLRYLLFEPGTGKLVSSGYGKAVRQTWGVPQARRVGLEERVRQAGRDVADQVISELKSRAAI